MSAEKFFLEFLFFRTSGCFSNISNFKFGTSFFFRKFEKSQKFKIKNNLFINGTALRAPPAVTRLTVHRRLQVIPGDAFWAHMPSSKSVTWQSNGSDFSKPDHYYCVTWILLKVSHQLEAFSLILSLWEAVVSDIDRRQLLKRWNFDFWDSFWNYEKL